MSLCRFLDRKAPPAKDTVSDSRKATRLTTNANVVVTRSSPVSGLEKKLSDFNTPAASLDRHGS
jgi:hypothetical protein